MIKFVLAFLNICLFIFLLSFFFDIGLEKFPQMMLLKASTLLTTKFVGIISLLITLAILLFLIFLFAVGLGGKFISLKLYFADAFIGLILFNLYYSIIYIFFEDSLRESIFYPDKKHLIFQIGYFLYPFYAIWLAIVIKKNARIGLIKSLLSIVIPLTIISAFKLFL